jgi:DNA-binding beta-propeller fold protein YncE
MLLNHHLAGIAGIAVLLANTGLLCSVSHADEPELATIDPSLDVSKKSHLRHPIDGVLLNRGRVLCIANRKSGTLSIIDRATERVVSEFKVARRLSAIAAFTDEHVLVTDDQQHQLILVSVSGRAKVLQRLPMPRFPTSIAVNSDRTHCFVSSKWDRSVSVFVISMPDPNADVANPITVPVLRHARTFQLTFEPHKLIVLPQSMKLAVAGSFAATIAVIDARRMQIDSVRSLPGHNIRGMAFDKTGERFFVSHQRLNGLAESSLEDLHWGTLTSSVIRILDVGALHNPKADLLKGASLIQLGKTEDGAADPAGIAVLPRNRLAVAVSGTHSVVICDLDKMRPEAKFGVGQRPVELIPNANGKTAFVCNQFDNSVCVADMETGRTTSTISLGPSPKLSARDLGEQHFFDARLSHDGWMSCHSCHTDGHSNDLSADTMGDISFGAAKRVPTLRGTRGTGPWGWTGRFANLHDQVSSTLITTMRTHDKKYNEKAADLVSYLNSLEPLPPFQPAVTNTDQDRVIAGSIVFKNRCGKCHQDSNLTSPNVYDVGLVDEVGNRKFNPPSLRGVGYRNRLFHDGRAKSIRSALTKHQHPASLEIPKQELDVLLRYIFSL